MNRLVRFFLLPTALTTLCLALTSWGVMLIWDAVGRDRSILSPSIVRPGTSPERIARLLEQADTDLNQIIIIGAIIVLLLSVFWHLSCLLTRLRSPGDAKKRSLVWFLFFALTILIYVAAGAYLAYQANLHRELATIAIIYHAVFSIFIVSFSFWLVCWLTTARMYVEGVFLGGLRPW